MKWNTIVKLVSIPEFIIGNGSQIEFDTKEEQEAFFESHKIAEYEWLDFSYVRSNGGDMKIKANKDTLDAKAPNWLMFKNTDFGDKWFYANILDSYYISPEVTQLTYAVDSFQSFMFEIDRTKLSYINRRTWSGKNDDENAIMQLPYEDIDIGNEFVNCDVSYDFNDSDGNYETEQFYYILLTTKLLESGSSHSIKTPKYSSQFRKGNETITKDFTNGENQVLFGYVCNYRMLNAFLEQGVFQKDCKIVNTLQLVMQLPFGRSLFRTGITNQSMNIRKDVTVTVPEGAELYDQGQFGLMQKEIKLEKWSSVLCDYINKSIENNYSAPYNDTMPNSAIGKYLFRYPFSLLETYDFFNQPDTVRIENLNRANQFEYIRSQLLPVFKYATIGQNPMLVYTIKGNKNVGVTKEYNDLNTIGSLSSITSQNMNTVQSTLSLPIISDYLASFLQANMNQINAQRANLKDSLATQMNNAGAAMQAQATSIAMAQRNAILSAHTQAINSNLQTNASLTAQIESINSQRDITHRTNANALNQANVSAIPGTIGGIASIAGGVGALAMGNIGGGIAGIGGGANALMNTGVNLAKANMNFATNEINAAQTQQTAMSNAQLLASAATQASGNTLRAATQMAANSAMAANAQAQVSYANTVRSAATGFRNEMRSLNARVEDAKNVPSSVQSMGNNNSLFNTLFNRNIIRFTTKSLPRTVMQRVIWYFVNNGFLTNNMDTLENIKNKFKTDPGYFVQTVNGNIGGKIPLEHLKQIKDMYDSGVYLWKKDHYLDYNGMRKV